MKEMDSTTFKEGKEIQSKSLSFRCFWGLSACLTITISLLLCSYTRMLVVMNFRFVGVSQLVSYGLFHNL